MGDSPAIPFSFLNMERPGWTPPTPQISCYGTRTTQATEALVLECMGSGRGAVFGSGMTMAQVGCGFSLCGWGAGAVFGSGMTMAQERCFLALYGWVAGWLVLTMVTSKHRPTRGDMQHRMQAQACM